MLESGVELDRVVRAAAHAELAVKAASQIVLVAHEHFFSSCPARPRPSRKRPGSNRSDSSSGKCRRPRSDARCGRCASLRAVRGTGRTFSACRGSRDTARSSSSEKTRSVVRIPTNSERSPEKKEVIYCLNPFMSYFFIQSNTGNLKMEPGNNDYDHQQQVQQIDRHQVLPFQTQQLVDSQGAGKST